MPQDIFLARAALHMWEEPCISGKEGSGTVFFSGCSMKCVFCQNRDIAIGDIGKKITVERLAEIFLELQQQGANNINLVTPTHYIPAIIEALRLAKGNGLVLPIVYNTSGYEKVESLRLLDGLVDIYLPDMKYYSAELSMRYSNAGDYFEVASLALAEMVRQTGAPLFEKDLMKRGVIVRHMILPGNTRDSKKILDYLLQTYGNQIYISLMSQYTPMQQMKGFEEIQRRVTRREYEKVVNYAVDCGLENGFFQEGNCAKDSFIPDFHAYTGVEKRRE